MNLKTTKGKILFALGLLLSLTAGAALCVLLFTGHSGLALVLLLFVGIIAMVQISVDTEKREAKMRTDDTEENPGATPPF